MALLFLCASHPKTLFGVVVMLMAGFCGPCSEVSAAPNTTGLCVHGDWIGRSAKDQPGSCVVIVNGLQIGATKLARQRE